MPKISVVMPVYNGEKYLREAIESILNQTYTDFEFIIINDGSTDKTKDIVLSYKDERILYLENEKNSGIVYTLNKGINNAKGEYIARMDSDDIAMPQRFEKQIKFMERNLKIGVLGTGLQQFGEEIQEKNRFFSRKPNLLKAELLFFTNIAHPTVMIRKSILDEWSIRYEKEYDGAEDFLMWWNLSQKTQIATLPDILLKYRIHNSQTTHDKGEKYKNLMNKMLKKRLCDMQYKPSAQGYESLLQYCIGDYDKYLPETIKQFINTIFDILKWNKTSAFFDNKSLQNVCSMAILASITGSNLCSEDKKKSYKYAVNRGIFSHYMRMKIFYHKIF